MRTPFALLSASALLLTPCALANTPLGGAGVSIQIIDSNSSTGLHNEVENKSEQNFDTRVLPERLLTKAGTFGPTTIKVGANVYANNERRLLTVGSGAQASSPDGNPLSLMPAAERFREWTVTANAVFRDALFMTSEEAIDDVVLTLEFEYIVPAVTKTSGKVSNGEFRPTSAFHSLSVTFDQAFNGPRASEGDFLGEAVDGTQTGSRFPGSGVLELKIPGKFARDGFKPSGYNNTAGFSVLRIESGSSINIPRYYAASALAGTPPEVNDHITIRLRRFRLTHADGRLLSLRQLGGILVNSGTGFDYLNFTPGIGVEAKKRRGRWLKQLRKGLTPDIDVFFQMEPKNDQAFFTLTASFLGRKITTKGRFDDNLDAHFGPDDALFLPVQSPNGLVRELRMKLDQSTLEGVVRCTVSEQGGGNPEGFELLPALYTAAPTVRPFRKVPATVLGTYHFELAAADQTRAGLPTHQYPQGAGWGRLTVKPTGAVVGSGKLADGTPFTFNTVLLDGLVASVAIPTDRGQGRVLGSFSFRGSADPDDVDSDDHLVAWYKPAVAGAARYAAGWPNGIPLDMRGSRYRVPLPTPAQSVLPGLGQTDPLNGNASFSASDLSGVFSKPVNISTANAFSVVTAAADKLRASIVKRTGAFNGSYTDPATVKTRSFSGVVLQKQQRISGYFLTPAESGHVQVQPLSGGD